MMVLRERKINNKVDIVQIHLSYGLPDIKALLKDYASRFEQWARNAQHSESDVIYWLEHASQAFNNYPVKWRVQLSRWAFAVAVRNRLLLPCATKEDSYFLADCLFAKRGRPRKADVLKRENGA